MISHMDKNGGFHPRRYVIQFDIGFGSDDENMFVTINLTVCEVGPRITLSFPEIGPITQASNSSGTVVHNVSKKLPVKLCPTEERGVVTSACFSSVVIGSTTSYMTGIFAVSPGGDIVFEYPGVVMMNITQTTIRPFCVTYDTGGF